MRAPALFACLQRHAYRDPLVDVQWLSMPAEAILVAQRKDLDSFRSGSMAPHAMRFESSSAACCQFVCFQFHKGCGGGRCFSKHRCDYLQEG